MSFLFYLNNSIKPIDKLGNEEYKVNIPNE